MAAGWRQSAKGDAMDWKTLSKIRSAAAVNGWHAKAIQDHPLKPEKPETT
jgi:hypothetical protein